MDYLLHIFYMIGNYFYPCLKPPDIVNAIDKYGINEDEVERTLQPKWHRIYSKTCLWSWDYRYAWANGYLHPTSKSSFTRKAIASLGFLKNTINKQWQEK